MSCHAIKEAAWINDQTVQRRNDIVARYVDREKLSLMKHWLPTTGASIEIIEIILNLI